MLGRLIILRFAIKLQRLPLQQLRAAIEKSEVHVLLYVTLLSTASKRCRAMLVRTFPAQVGTQCDMGLLRSRTPFLLRVTFVSSFITAPAVEQTPEASALPYLLWQSLKMTSL